MGNPQMESELKNSSSPNLSRESSGESRLTANGGSQLLHSQVAKLRTEEKYLSENVREGMEMLDAISQIMSTVKDLSMQQEAEMRRVTPSPLGLRSAVWDRRSFVASSG